MLDNVLLYACPWGYCGGGLCNNDLSGEIMNWKIGDKIVCISKFKGVFVDTNEPTGSPNPIVGIVYTFDGYRKHNTIYLKEFEHYINNRGFRPHYASYKFRKLSEVSSELSEEILNEVLTTIPELV